MKNIKHHVFIMFIYAMLVLNFTNASSETKPVLNIKGNGIANQIILKPSDILSLKVDMDPGSLSGSNADWWVVAKTPSGNWYSWVYPTGWINIGTDLYAISVTYQGALFALTPFEVLSASNLAEGDYDLYFGIDTNMNGILDYQSLSYSALKVTVSSTPCTLPQVLQNGVCVTPEPLNFSGKWRWSGVSGITVKPPFSFVAEDGIIKSLVYEYSLTNGGQSCNGYTTPYFNPNAAIANGQFTINDSSDDRTVTISGSFFSNTEASGTIYISGQNCGPITLPWNATRKEKLNSLPAISLTTNNVSSTIHQDASGKTTGATVNFKPTVSDADGDSLTCTWSKSIITKGTIVGDCASGTWERPIFGSFGLDWGGITITVTDGKSGGTLSKTCSFDSNTVEPSSCN